MKPVTNKEINVLLTRIFKNSGILLASIAPNGWRLSSYVNFFHPTPEQQYEEEKALTERFNKFAKNEKSIEVINPDKYQQDNLNDIDGDCEFQLVLGLSVYDIFSDNHEVYSTDGRVYVLGSFRGSGRYIANFLNDNYPGCKNYEYLDFYMGSIWIRDRASLLPFYEYIFQTLKEEGCDWKYCFPRLYLLDFSSNESPDINPVDYKPDEAVTNELEKLNEKKEFEKFQNDLDETFEKEYEEANYKPLITIVQAYKNIYGRLPEGHPQKEFE